MNIEDGYYISFFSDDDKKAREPRAIVVVKDGVVEICPNSKSPDDGEWLTSLSKKLSSLDPKSDEYAYEAERLNNFWDYNGYTPNPSDFISIQDYDGKYDDQIKRWKVK